MTDLEITRLCAQAMGVDVHESTFNSGRIGLFPRTGYEYEPLHDDAECMAMVKKFRIWIMWDAEICNCSIAADDEEKDGFVTQGSDLNRAICECVAKFQQERQK